jgi:hypothetical protein
VQGHQRALDREYDEQQHAGQPHQRQVGLRYQRHLEGQVGHVERAGEGVDQSDRKQKQRRAGEVDRDVLQPLGDAAGAGAVKHEAVGRDQQDLEEDEKVEDVAGKESAVDAHQLELKQGVEMATAPVPALCRIDHDEHSQDRRQKDHQRRQPVEHQDDAERWRPVPQGIGPDPAVVGEHEQSDGHGEQEDGGSDPEHTLEHNVVANRQHDERCNDGRQDDGDDDPVVQRRSSGVRDRPSTWSRPVSR